MNKSVVTLLVFVSILVVNYFYWIRLLDPVDQNKTVVIFELRPGPLKKVAEDLNQKGIIKSAGAFTVYSRLKNEAGNIRVGEYALNTSMSANEVLDIITSGKSIEYTVTFQEGLNLFEYAQILATKNLVNEQEFVELCKNQDFIKSLLGVTVPSLEGYLFPETYKFTKFIGAREMIRTMVAKTKSVFGEINHPKLKDPHERHKVLILASIVEKETGAGFERDKVASVFYNRLKKGMKLQSDPTIIYGAKYDLGVNMENIRKTDILYPTRFNTYVVKALPMGPISNPGRAAIEAVLKPAQTEYLYFVSYNDGTHVFTKTYKDHLAAVKKYQQDSSNRKGKSWRDLSKKKK